MVLDPYLHDRLHILILTTCRLTAKTLFDKKVLNGSVTGHGEQFISRERSSKNAFIIERAIENAFGVQDLGIVGVAWARHS